MLLSILRPPRGAATRAFAGKLSFLALVTWLLAQLPVVWAGNPGGALLALTLVSWGTWSIGVAAVLLPRLGAVPLLLLGVGTAVVVGLGLSVFLGLLFVPAIGGSLALWLYWRGGAATSVAPSRADGDGR